MWVQIKVFHLITAATPPSNDSMEHQAAWQFQLLHTSYTSGGKGKTRTPPCQQLFTKGPLKYSSAWLHLNPWYSFSNVGQNSFYAVFTFITKSIFADSKVLEKSETFIGKTKQERKLSRTPVSILTASFARLKLDLAEKRAFLSVMKKLTWFWKSNNFL